MSTPNWLSEKLLDSSQKQWEITSKDNSYRKVYRLSLLIGCEFCDQANKKNCCSLHNANKHKSPICVCLWEKSLSPPIKLYRYLSFFHSCSLLVISTRKFAFVFDRNLFLNLLESRMKVQVNCQRSDCYSNEHKLQRRLAHKRPPN